MALRRVVTVASGKGGVGKSTFAVNYALALSRVAPTVLVDLDTGTSSVRNTIDAPVQRDLYHFLRRGEPLERCLTTLPPAPGPAGAVLELRLRRRAAARHGGVHQLLREPA
ncbi:MAG: P-loop NTPase [Thermoanaerobaculaceae bacterium]